MAQVELPLVVKKRVLDVFLENKGSQLAIAVPLPALQTHLDIIQSIAYCNAIASICVLSWFHYPNISDMLLALLFLFDHFVIFGEAKVLWVFRASSYVEGQR